MGKAAVAMLLVLTVMGCDLNTLIPATAKQETMFPVSGDPIGPITLDAAGIDVFTTSMYDFTKYTSVRISFNIGAVGVDAGIEVNAVSSEIFGQKFELLNTLVTSAGTSFSQTLNVQDVPLTLEQIKFKFEVQNDILVIENLLIVGQRR